MSIAELRVDESIRHQKQLLMTFVLQGYICRHVMACATDSCGLLWKGSQIYPYNAKVTAAKKQRLAC